MLGYLDRFLNGLGKNYKWDTCQHTRDIAFRGGDIPCAAPAIAQCRIPSISVSGFLEFDLGTVGIQGNDPFGQLLYSRGTILMCVNASFEP
jgi:hypothetical protein